MKTSPAGTRTHPQQLCSTRMVPLQTHCLRTPCLGPPPHPPVPLALPSHPPPSPPPLVSLPLAPGARPALPCLLPPWLAALRARVRPCCCLTGRCCPTRRSPGARGQLAAEVRRQGLQSVPTASQWLIIPDRTANLILMNSIRLSWPDLARETLALMAGPVTGANTRIMHLWQPMPVCPADGSAHAAHRPMSHASVSCAPCAQPCPCCRALRWRHWICQSVAASQAYP